MKKLWPLYLITAFVGVFVILHAQTPPPVQPVLSFTKIDVQDNATAIVDWQNINPAPITAEGGSGTIPIVCYLGAAYRLSVDTNTIPANGVLIEYSTNLLTGWLPFPTAELQLTLTAETPSFTNIFNPPNLFFRAVVKTNN